MHTICNLLNSIIGCLQHLIFLYARNTVLQALRAKFPQCQFAFGWGYEENEFKVECFNVPEHLHVPIWQFCYVLPRIGHHYLGCSTYSARETAEHSRYIKDL